MKQVEPARILVVDDDPYILGLLKKYFEANGFLVDLAENGASALELFQQRPPDLVLLDVMMPKLNGYSACREIRKRSRSRRVPIIFLTALGDTEQKVEGLEEGADDYVTKPFNLDELKARVKANIRRAGEEQSKNPLTGLPGNQAIRHQLDQLLESDDPWAILYADLDYFKAYNDTYGFAAGDEVILMTAAVLEKSLHRYGQPGDFLGHIGGDDFILTTSPEYMEEVVNAIFINFEVKIRQFYKLEDLEQGFISTIDRSGAERRFPIMTISIGGVTNRIRPYRSYAEVSTVAAEMKKFAKSLSGRKFAIDRRQQ